MRKKLQLEVPNLDSDYYDRDFKKALNERVTSITTILTAVYSKQPTQEIPKTTSSDDHLCGLCSPVPETNTKTRKNCSCLCFCSDSEEQSPPIPEPQDFSLDA